MAIVAKIESSASAFDTSVAALVALAGKGVDSQVIAAMVAGGGSGGAGVGTGAAGAQPKAIPAGRRFRDSLQAAGEGPEMAGSAWDTHPARRSGCPHRLRARKG